MPPGLATRHLAVKMTVMLRQAQPGYWRKVNCLPNSYGDGEGWSWQLTPADGPGRGAFEGVYFPR